MVQPVQVMDVLACALARGLLPAEELQLMLRHHSYEGPENSSRMSMLQQTTKLIAELREAHLAQRGPPPAACCTQLEATAWCPVEKGQM